MEYKRIYLSSPHMSNEKYEEMYVKEAFDTNWIAPLGNNVNEFENELKNLVGIKGATALISGSSAIHLALKAAGIRPGDKVFCQSLTFSATANPIIYECGIPIFIDSDEDNWNISPQLLRQAFKEHPDVRIVIVVHLYGITAKMEEIKEICRENNACLIEDAAESLGSLYKGKYTGTLGDFGIYSFNGNKIITTSGGGMLVSENTEKIEKAKFWATQARDKAPHYQHSELGYNYRMSNVLAGIGRGQLKVLPDRVEKKRWIYHYYKNNLSDIKEIQFMPEENENRYNYWLSTIIIDSPKVTPDNIRIHLGKYNIESRPMWKPMHIQPYFDKYISYTNGISEYLFSKGLCLPSDTKLEEKDLQFIVEKIKECFN